MGMTKFLPFFLTIASAFSADHKGLYYFEDTLKGGDKNMEKKLNAKKPKKKVKKKGPALLPNEYWTGYKLHERTQICFYCMGERTTINIDGKQYPPIGADGATVVICNTLHL